MPNLNYMKIISCETNMPPDQHEFSFEVHHGNYDRRGNGTMEYRRCLKCGTIEYSKFTSDDGDVEDIDAIYRGKCLTCHITY